MWLGSQSAAQPVFKDVVMIRTVQATRYLQPLREGGSLPAIIEADDGQQYVLKFRGAGQGPKVLIAELIAGELARALDLPMPEIVLVELDPALGRNEPDYEIRGLIMGSAGLNLALTYLPGALSLEPSLAPPAATALASEVVWFDAYITNVDRTPRNTNLLIWHHRMWLIDHGAALYFHYAWDDYLTRSQTPFGAIKDHVLLPYADDLAAVSSRYSALLTPALIERTVGLIPDSWLDPEPHFADRAALRAAYSAYLQQRVEAAPIFVQEAINARARRV